MALRADERRDKLRKASGRSKYPVIRRCLNGETHMLSLIHIYGLTACLAIAVLTVGVNFYRSYQNVKQNEKESATVSSVIPLTLSVRLL